ncbi:helix-turn-helix domain-containing protein [Rhizosphaericola mali]|uniref:Helix-turn-helix transcriptional regulator n=1 Tax=Rhizosphaericola mali TaxID=2545455 RepID=A0A5P2FYS3_9BACT|nr:helix-turn-helix domain-containing protein [Rhizosphaericola mali]QES88345.1 helix-turn-helix transcriptional regulator [Rhizosphaericola mali]
MKESKLLRLNSISQLVRALGLPGPSHPLITLVDYAKIPQGALTKNQKISLDFFKISFKPNYKGRTKYGQGYYDFEEGGLAFIKPNQIVFSPENLDQYEGVALYFHPDFIRSYPLGTNIHNYGFFSYNVSEALFLSANEKEIVGNLFTTIASELQRNIDHFTQDVLVSQLELLLNYSNRFYDRQFITRKAVNNDKIRILDQLLNDFFEDRNGSKNGPPSVAFICQQMQLSQRYLSDMLHSLTGMNTQQYIQNAIIEKAKEKLSTTELSVSEIAYDLGFEHPQSFSKLFKKQMNQSPLEFRNSFN